MQADAEARIEGALDHALAVHFENLRAGEPTHQRFAHLGRVGAVLGSEQQRLGHRLDVQRDDDLVGHLGGLAVAVAADAGDVLAHPLEQRQGALEGIRAAADHDRQGGGLGAHFTAGDRGVEVGGAGGLDLLGELLGGGRRDRTHVDHHLAGADAFGHAVLAEQHVLDMRGVRHHDDDELGFLGDFLRVGQGDGAAFDQRGRSGVVVSGNEDVVTGFLQVECHGQTHDAGADESDFSHESSPSIQSGVASVQIALCAFIQPRPASVVVAGLYSQPTQPW
ncbi:hypothetical protein SSTU70S_03743 [Stutzerimonas stutzeri]